MRRRPVPADRDPGAVGQVHAAAVRRSRSARLVAVADTVPDLLTPFEARGVSGYPGAEELIAGYRTGPALSMFRDRRWREVPVPPDDWQTSVQASVAAYLDAVTVGREPPVTGAAALDTMRLLDRIHRTAVVLPGGDSPGRPARP
jgi:hypothetical protein